MKKNRKIPMVCLAVLLLFFSTVASALAETATGMIFQVTGDGFSLHTDESVLRVAVTADTFWDTDAALTDGDVVTVHSDSPADGGVLYADRISCHTIRGIIDEAVTDTEEPYLLLLSDGGGERVRVNLGSISMRTVAPGLPALIYYNGIQTRSIPPQITAQYLRGLTLCGTIAEIEADGRLLLLKEDGETVILHLSEETHVLTDPEIGKPVSVSVLPQLRLSLPAQYEAQDILPANQ